MYKKLPSNKLKTSIVIRSKSENKHLNSLLCKLYKQTMMAFEIIIIDNDSHPSIHSVIKSFPVTALATIPKDKFNHALSLNLGIYLAKTNFVVLINAHCLPISNTWLENGLSNFDDKKVAAIDGNYRAGKNASFNERLNDIWQADTLNIVRYNETISSTNSIIRKSIWKDYQFDESLSGCEDYDWSREVMEREYKTIKDPKFNVYHSHGLGYQQLVKQLARWKRLCPQIDKRIRPHKSVSKVFNKSFLSESKIKINYLL